MKARIPMSSNQKRAMDDEIKRQLAEYDRKNSLEIDAMVLWVLYSEFGFKEKRLRRFFDIFESELDKLCERYELPNSDTTFLCTRKLKDEAGIDILKWSEETKED